MVKFKGETFYRLSQLLAMLNATHSGTVSGMKAAVESLRKELHLPAIDFSSLDSATLGEAGQRGLARTLEIYQPHLQNAGLVMSLKSFERLVSRLGLSPILLSDLVDLANELQQRLQDELEDAQLWQVAREDLKHLISDPFGPEVSARFALARDDIEEAGKCLAFGRGTASVFHLMRVMEVGLRALAKSLNDSTLDPKTNPSWERILSRGDKELQKPLKDRSAEWQADEAFFSTAQANLRAVKDAWRNPTMHVERKYDPEEAADVWNAVRGFMRHLATRLSA